MASIVKSAVSFGDPVTQVELTGSDTLGSKTGTLWIRNESVSPVTINILGDAATTAEAAGVGVVDLSGGYDINIDAGELVPFQLSAIAAYLQGDIVDVTGGTSDVFAYII